MLYWFMYISMANGAMFVYRCCVQLFIIIHLVPILIHKPIAMCILVALHCCINILNCISKYLSTNIKLLYFVFLLRRSLTFFVQLGVHSAFLNHRLLYLLYL